MQEILKDSITVLGILQNYYAGAKYRGKRIPTPYPSWHPTMVNRRNATYSRIIPYCEKQNIKLWLTECTDVIAGERTDKFVYKLDVLNESLNACDWDAIIAFGVHAKSALKILEIEQNKKIFYLPHPASFLWRKSLYIDTINSIIEVCNL